MNDSSIPPSTDRGSDPRPPRDPRPDEVWIRVLRVIRGLMKVWIRVLRVIRGLMKVCDLAFSA